MKEKMKKKKKNLKRKISIKDSDNIIEMIRRRSLDPSNDGQDMKKKKTLL